MAAHRDAVIQTLRERRPCNFLAPYVTCVRVQEVSPEPLPYRHRTVPNGSAELICEVGGPARIVGPQTGPVDETLAPGTTIVGVRMQPGAARSLLGVPGSAIVDVNVPAVELWGDSISQLVEAVADAATPGRSAALLEIAVADRLPSAPATHPIVDSTDLGLDGTARVFAVGYAPETDVRMLRRAPALTGRG